MLKTITEIIESIEDDDSQELRNVGTFTAIHRNELVRQYLDKYLHKNLVDKKAYKSLKMLEEHISDFFIRLFEASDGKVLLTSGSTESILISLYFAREKALTERGIKRPNIVVPQSAHYSIFKCSRLLGIQVKTARLNKDLTIDVQDAAKKIDKNTILLVGVLGSTELGTVDDVEKMDKLALDTSLPLHIDAAIGGFIIPFLKTNLKYKFSQMKSLQTLNISGHKFGLSLPGCGVLILNDKKLSEQYSDHLEYLSSGKELIEGLMVTSSPAGLFSLGINIMQYQYSGFATFAAKYLETKQEIMASFKLLGVDFFPGSEYIPQIFVDVRDAYQLSVYLSQRKWIQSVYTPKGLNRPGFRIVIKKDQERIIEKEFLKDVAAYIIEKNSVGVEKNPNYEILNKFNY